MATPEAKASQSVRLRATAWGARVFRNNSGVLLNEVGVPVRFGVGNESKEINKKMKTGDFIGWTPITITQDMVGKQVAVFTNIEAKAVGFKHRKTYPAGSRENGQQNFNNIVNLANGIAGFAADNNDVDCMYNEFIKRVTK